MSFLIYTVKGNQEIPDLAPTKSPQKETARQQPPRYNGSGRLRDMLHQIAGEHGWEWQAHVVINPDPVLAAAQEVIATADGIVLDQCRQWFNLACKVVAVCVPDANVLRLA